MNTTTLFIGLTLALSGTAGAQLFPERDPADVNGDGVINAVDMAAVLGKWGPAPQPWAIVLERCPDPTVVTDEKLREAIAATGLPWRVQDLGTGIEMLLVPPGTFMMGCSPSNQWGCQGDEGPVHEVTLTQAFYLGRYEVTQAQWTAVMGSNPSAFQGDSDSAVRPVEQVSWNMTQQFMAETGFRLPTEAEWEFACRAGTTSAFNNGGNDAADLQSLGWYNGNAKSSTHPVGSKQANALGAFDMHGNVAEWCSDWYSDQYYIDSPSVNPSGPAHGIERVVRGGHLATHSGNHRSSRRLKYEPSLGYFGYGFRVARTP